MSEHRVRQFSKWWLVLLLLCGARELPAGFVCQPGTPGPPAVNMPGMGTNTTFSLSTTCSEQVQTTNLTQRVDQFSTELRARLPGGPLLLDQTFAAPFSDPVVQSALVSAQQLLTAQGAKGFVGPALLNNTTTLTGTKTVASVIQTAPSQDLIKTTTTVGGFTVAGGPRITVQIGTIGQCQGVTDIGPAPNGFGFVGNPFGCDPNAGSLLTVAFGTDNINVNVHTLYSLGVTNTTTNTFLTSQIYEMDGTSAPAISGVPELGTFALTALAIAGLWGLRLRMRRTTRGE